MGGAVFPLRLLVPKIGKREQERTLKLGISERRYVRFCSARNRRRYVLISRVGQHPEKMNRITISEYVGCGSKIYLLKKERISVRDGWMTREEQHVRAVKLQRPVTGGEDTTIRMTIGEKEDVIMAQKKLN